MKFQETRVLRGYELQNLCIKKSWYTRGTCKEYQRILDKADECENITTEMIAEIAEDIINHSSGITMEDITSVMFDLAKECVTFFNEVEE